MLKIVASQIKTICKYCIYLVIAGVLDWDTVFKTEKWCEESNFSFYTMSFMFDQRNT